MGTNYETLIANLVREETGIEIMWMERDRALQFVYETMLMLQRRQNRQGAANE